MGTLICPLLMRSIKRLLKRARIIFATLQDWKIEVPDVGATAALLARHGLDGGADYRIEREP